MVIDIDKEEMKHSDKYLGKRITRGLFRKSNKKLSMQM